jgi:hypothetical protein
LIDAQYTRAIELVKEHHEEIVALYLELWHKKVRGTPCGSALPMK